MNIDLKQLAYAIFDCDGVIVDSNEIKSAGFVAALEGEPEDAVNAFIKYHQDNGGISRFVKFRKYYTDIHPSESIEQSTASALKRYANYLAEELPKAALVTGVAGVIEEMHGNSIPLYVISGGEETEVRALLHNKQLADHFIEINGSPITKLQHLDRLKDQSLLDGNGIYFGDGSGDYKAAQQFDIPFCFVSGVSEWTDGINMANRGEYPSIRDFSDLITK